MKAEDIYVGQRVQFRDWEDMKAEFGELEKGYINCTPCFSKHMKYLCGKEFTVESAENGIIYKPKFYHQSRWWIIGSEMLKPVFCTAPVSCNVEVDLL